MQFLKTSFWSQGRIQARWRGYLFRSRRESANQEKISRKVSSRTTVRKDNRLDKMWFLKKQQIIKTQVLSYIQFMSL